MDVTPEAILDIQLKSQAQVGVVLDHPFTPDAGDKPERIDRTLANTEVALNQLLENQSSFNLMFAVHGHTTTDMCRCISQLKAIAKRSKDTVIKHVGIGSIAPLAQRGNSRLAVEIISLARQNLPDAHLHCFSMGSALLMLLAFYCGADTVDSQSWIVSAAFKLAQLPGHYVMRMARREYKSDDAFKQAKFQFAERLKHLSDTEGFVVKDWNSGNILCLLSDADREQYVENLVDSNSNENIHNRACHNLWVYNYEMRKARQAISENRFEEFVEQRLTGTRYMKDFEYARSLRL